MTKAGAGRVVNERGVTVAAQDIDWLQPRPASLVMRAERVAAVFPTALSFARTIIDKLLAGSWRLERVRMELDAEGRGEVLYRLDDGRNPLHFFILSDSFSGKDKADRSFNMNWDGTAALCEGSWTAEREAYLRRELPKQRFGRLDHQTLAYTRGNRSGRIFDQVVEALTAGEQPDGAALARIGYIFRTTGFTANGFIGMRSYLGMERDHLLCDPYHAQMLSAFLLREYVADLVDAMAAARNPSAAKLSLPMRRYLGIGNSAGLGLTPFIYNHPAMVHRWTSLKEQALAHVRRQGVGAGDAAVDRFRVLLARARRYFTEDPREAYLVFAAYTETAEQLNKTLSWTETQLFSGLGATPRLLWRDLAAWAEEHLKPEPIEVLNTILLELYPEITRQYAAGLTVDETLDYDPAMTVGDLKALISENYGWAAERFADLPGSAKTFWYMSIEAPYEPRRGRRGGLPDYEFETHMDAPIRFRLLQDALAAIEDETSVAELLLFRPDLRNVVNRLATLAGQDYAELRENTHADGHLTFGSTRFMLSHYGMDRLDAQYPRSVKGVLMQGAPVGADLDAGYRGDWPFPVVPDAGDAPVSAPAYKEERQRGAKELRQIAVWQETEFGERITIAPVELLRWGQRALQARGLEFGASITGAWLAHLREILFGDGIDLVISAGTERRMRATAQTSVMERDGGVLVIRPGAASAFAALPSLLDMASHDASEGGDGVAIATGLSELKLAAVLPIWATRRGYALTALWRDGSEWMQATGGPGEHGQTYMVERRGADLPTDALPEAARREIEAMAGEDGICVLVARGVSAMVQAEPGATPPLGPREIDQAYRSGVMVEYARLEEIKAMAFETLVPVELEHKIATE